MKFLWQDKKKVTFLKYYTGDCLIEVTAWEGLTELLNSEY